MNFTGIQPTSLGTLWQCVFLYAFCGKRSGRELHSFLLTKQGFLITPSFAAQRTFPGSSIGRAGGC